MELFQKGTIRLGSNQMINYVDSRGKEDLVLLQATGVILNGRRNPRKLSLKRTSLPSGESRKQAFSQSWPSTSFIFHRRERGNKRLSSPSLQDVSNILK